MEFCVAQIWTLVVLASAYVTLLVPVGVSLLVLEWLLQMSVIIVDRELLIAEYAFGGGPHLKLRRAE